MLPLVWHKAFSWIFKHNRGILAFVAYFQDFYEVQPCSLGLLPQILASFAVVMCGVGGCKMTHNGNVAGG